MVRAHFLFCFGSFINWHLCGPWVKLWSKREVCLVNFPTIATIVLIIMIYQFFSSVETMKTMIDLWSLWVTPAEFCINLHTFYGLFYNNVLFWLDTNAILESLTFYSIMFIRSFCLSVFKGIGSGGPCVRSAFLFWYFSGPQLTWTGVKMPGSWLGSFTDIRESRADLWIAITTMLNS